MGAPAELQLLRLLPGRQGASGQGQVIKEAETIRNPLYNYCVF